MDMHLQPEDECKYKCGECGRAYKHAGSLANHKKTHDVGIFQCNICGKENSNALALKNHLRSHTSQKKYPCLECGKAFHRPSQLVMHERIHVSMRTKEHSVSEVDMECVTQEDQNGHTDCFLSSGMSTQICQSEDITDVACDTQAESSDLDRPFKCDFCDKSYIHQGSLSNHIKTHQTGKFECTVCFKLFNNMAALYSHQRTHKSKSQVDSLIGPSTTTSLDQFLSPSQDVPVNFCHLCQVLFSCEEEFQDHIQIHNSSPLLDQNDGALCNNSTTFSESNLKDVSSHNYSFDLFNEQIPTNYDNLHTTSLNSTETGLSTFFAQTNNSDRASAVDSDVRPYSCDICCKTYRHYGSLVNHKRSHQVGNYQCSICGKSCPHLAAFKNHIRIHKTSPSCASQNWLSSELQTPKDKGQHVETEHQNESESNGHLNLNSGQAFGDFTDNKFQNVFSVQQQDFESSIFNESNDHIEDSGYALDFGGLNNNHMQSDQFLENTSNDSLNCSVATEQEEDDTDFFQCSICGNRYNSARELKGHMQEHTDSTPPNSVSSPMSRAEQIKEELGDMIICCLCGESFSHSQDLVHHQLQHSTDHMDNAQNCNNDKCEEKNKNLICGSCDVSCTSLSQLENHKCKVDTNHSTANNGEEMKEPRNYADTSLVEEERQFKCEECGRSYRHAGSLLNHKKSHKTGLFRCHVCQKSFYNLLALKNHQRSHFDIKRFKCDECGKAYKTQKQLLNHLRRHKKEAQAESQRQTLVQIKENESDGGIQSSSTNASQDFYSENTQEELKESEVTNKSVDCSEVRPFACDQCGRTYRHAGSLVNHKNSHKTGEYLCSICNNAYSNQLALKNHLRTHFAFKRHSCPKCGKKFRSRNQLSVHICTNSKRRRRGRPLKSTREAVSSESSGKEERPFTCTICNRSYRHASSLLNHKNTHKTGHYNCMFCSKHFTNPMALRNHTRIHTQKKRYVCLTCGKAFRVASVLYNHQRVHTGGPGRFSCPDCGMRFKGRSGLQRHQCSTGQESGTPDQHSARRDKCFKCDLCGRSYHHAGSLLTHKKTHSENLHHCTLCLLTFPDPIALDAHSQLRRHSCPECGKTFCLLSHLQSHMEVHDKDRNTNHNEENDLSEDHKREMIKEKTLSSPPTMDPAGKVYACEYCGRSYRHAGSLLNHKNSHKTGRFSCSVCQKEFTNLMALKNHRRIHTEPKRYQCLECGKAFRVSSQLICHRRIHTRERPFTCPVCGKSFSSKSNLRHHEKMHHISTQDQTLSTDANGSVDLDISISLNEMFQDGDVD